MSCLSGLLRSHHCGELRALHQGQQVTLCGWVNKIRNLGGLYFIDLRDKYGLTQLTLDQLKEGGELLKAISLESVLKVSGVVGLRPEKDRNAQMNTGDIEVSVHSVELLSKAEAPPFLPSGKIEATEELRLRYRYLDLRSSRLQEILALKTKAMQTIRNVLVEESFTEVETPILYKTTPEGARDFIVPSRVHPGKVYALPQSPQTLKQLLMIGGTDKYFQIARCFRDEALRADRQPEFTQVDIEVSFPTQTYIKNLVERLMVSLFHLPQDFKVPLMSFDEAMERYGSDKPDVRFGLPHLNMTAIAKELSFEQLKKDALAGGLVKAIFLPASMAEITRKDLDQLPQLAKDFGVDHCYWFKSANEGLSGGIAKFIDAATFEKLKDLSDDAMKDSVGTWLVVGSEEVEKAHAALDAIRRHVAQKYNLIPADTYAFLWVYDFPLLEWDSERKRFVARHHPFTSPVKEDFPLFFSNEHEGLLKCRGDAYDIVCNGHEIGGGSLRIFNNDVQKRMFEVLGMSEDEIRHQFGFFIDALKYGTPPHGGIALGLDRIVMLLAKTDNIRDVIAFPKTTSATDLMAQAPSAPSEDQTSELHFQWRPSKV